MKFSFRVKIAFLVVFLNLGLAASSIFAAPMQVVNSHTLATEARVSPLGRLSSQINLHLAFGLPWRNETELTNLLRQIYDPASPNYHHYLSPEEFTAKFGPTEADYKKVIAFAVANGLKVTGTHSNRMLLDVDGEVAKVENALHLNMRTYRHPTENRTFYAPDAQPTIDLTVPVLGISGLDNYSLPHPQMKAALISSQTPLTAPNSGAGPRGTYMGNDFRAAYLPGVSLTGTGQTVGLLQFDGYTAADISYYEAVNGLPNVSLQNVLLDGFSGNPTVSGGEVEVSLDIEMSISMAPGLSKIIVYEAGPSGNWHDILNRMATDNLARQLSCSWYIPSGAADPVADQIFQEMALQGQSFFNASGDNDAYTGLISFPGDSPYITQVGGTTLATTGPGGSYVSEQVWNWEDGTGSGGGISTQYGIPSWQSPVSMAGNQGSSVRRNTPDVALTADNVYVRADGSDYDVGGTSAAAPLWAGFSALVNQQAASYGLPAIGFANPLIYKIGLGAGYSTSFRDIATGNNESPSSPSKFSAVTGYDLCTGWGTPNGQGLINALLPEPLVITPATGFASSGKAGGPFTVTSQVLSLTNAGTNILNWALGNNVNWLNVSPTGGVLTVGGPRTLVTVSLNSNASNLVAGVTYTGTLLFTNLGDLTVQTRQYSLSVIAPPAITLQPTNQTALDGASVTYQVAATGGLPLYYQWRLNGTNLTDGFGINGSATTNLIIANVSSTNAGIYSVTVSNVAGVVTSSNATLSITPSVPVIVMQPPNRLVGLAQGTTFTVAAIGTKPFSYQWYFNGLTNALAGATNATLALAGIQYSNIGNYFAVITNIYGATTSSNGFLNVQPCQPPPASMVGWWPAEGNANDIAGTNNGTLLGTVNYGPGEVGLAFVFADTNAAVLIPASPGLNVGLNDGFTLEGWIAPSNTLTSMPLFEWNTGGGTYGVHFWMFPSAALYANIVDTSGNSHIVQTPANLFPTNGFQHVALTYSQSSGNVTLYCNGSVVLQQSIGAVTPQTSYNLYLGKRPLGDGLSYSGSLDEMTVYSRALAASEIQAVYAAGAGGKCSSPTAPVFIMQPTNQTVGYGGTATFTAVAGGTSPISYQWYFGGTNNPVPGATGTTLTIAGATPGNAGGYSLLASNLLGTALSSNAFLVVTGAAPVITAQPQSQTQSVGYAAVFNVTATSAAPMYYQWYLNTTNNPVVGATNSTLTLANVQLGLSGNVYLVAVTNVFGTTLSSNATLTVVGVPPTITLQPTNLTVSVGATANFSVVAAGSLPLSYQWYFGGTGNPISGATNATLTLANVQSGQIGTYSVLVTNAYGSILSSNASLAFPTCDPLPSGLVSWWQAEGNASDTIGTNNGTVQNNVTYGPGEVGMSFRFSPPYAAVRIPASPSLNVGLSNGFTIEGWIEITNLTSYPIMEWNNNGGAYGVHFWVFPSGELYANIVDTGGANHILQTGANILSNGGFQHVALSYSKTTGVMKLYRGGVVVAQSTIGTVTPQTTYTLFLGERPATGGTTNCFVGWMDEMSLYNRTLADSEVQAINNVGSSGKCTPANPPVIIVQPTNEVCAIGGTATLSSQATGTPPLYYQWNFNGTNDPIAGATNSVLTLTNVQLANAGNYSVSVQNLFGLAIRSNATLTVTGTPPALIAQPTSRTAKAGSTVVFAVAATGSPVLIYQWYANTLANPLSGATNAVLTLSGVQPANAGNYFVQVTNSLGSITSSNALLTVYTQDHFTWSNLVSPKFVNLPFTVSIAAQDVSNNPASGFNGTVSLTTLSGIPVNPPVSANFSGGLWVGQVTIAQAATNLVLQAADGLGESGQANAINITPRPVLVSAISVNSLVLSWPVAAPTFVLEASGTLSPANWQPVSQSPVQISGQNFLALPLSQTNNFYRLRYSGP